MAEFKCISCGAVKESEKSCSCPVCGYKMLETPYDKDEALRREISTNPGLESRIQFTLEFPDYTREELGLIAQSFLEKKGYSIDDEALNRLLDIMEYFRSRPNFANARTVRNVLDQVIMNQNLRTEDENGDSVIIVDDVDDYLMDEGIDLSKPSTGTKKIGFQ